MSVFEDMVDELRAELYDRDDDPMAEPLPEFHGCCGACDELDRCGIPGHEEVGYCYAQGEFHLVTDPDECD